MNNDIVCVCMCMCSVSVCVWRGETNINFCYFVAVKEEATIIQLVETVQALQISDVQPPGSIEGC